MSIGTQILFFLAGLGVFNGILLSLYFVFGIRPKKWFNVLFGLLLMMLCVRIGKSVLLVFADASRLIRQLGLSACIFVGPLLYLYLRSFILGEERASRSDFVHLGVPLFCIAAVGLYWPYEEHPEIWNQYFVHGIYWIWITYVIVSLRLLLRWKRNGTSKRAIHPTKTWLWLVYGCVTALCLAYNLALYGFPYLTGPFLFSVVLYLLMGFLASRDRRTIVSGEIVQKYVKQKIADDRIHLLIDQLKMHMLQERPYLQPKIKLPGLAQSIGASSNELSQILNEYMGVTFNQYINEFRIQEACRMLKDQDHLSIEGIGQEVGFSSRSAFYNAFKGIVNRTPAQYRSQVKVGNHFQSEQID